MYVNKNFKFVNIMRFSGHHIVWIGLWSTLITCIYHYTHSEWLNIPWLPLSVMGTTVAFYLGFKNNQAYDRLWEARKIWGAIVNSSRAWGSVVKSFVGNQFRENDLENIELQKIHKRMIYRHVGWLYSLRSQLLIPTSWEHISQGGHMSKATEKRMKRYGVGLVDDDVTEKNLKFFLAEDHCDTLINYTNTATQIIDLQAQELKTLRQENLIDDFRHMEMQQILYDFYIHQGKAERIKKFPLPRQYGSVSFIFVILFILLLPFGMVSEFAKMGDLATWLAIPASILVGWVFMMMELVGDYSENPFEGLGNDIPMLSLCRVIEIDLREMLGETELPPKIQAVDGVLM